MSVRLTEARNKYHNVKAWSALLERQFHSRLEARYAEVLTLRERAGEITNLQFQVRFTLVEGYRNRTGAWVRPIEIVIDFVYWDSDRGFWIAADTKGFETAVWRLKRKLFEQRFQNYQLEIVREA